jgi:hypothetical protein
MWRHRQRLREAGFLYPGENQRDVFHAAIELRGTHQNWGLREEEIAGTWRRLCAEARTFPGTTILSHESLSAATAEQAAAARVELEGLDVHLVFTARDLVRQVMSEWQERVKNGSAQSFASFQRAVERQLRQGDFSSLFWRHQDPRGALSRWGDGLPPDKFHLVVAPPPGGDPLVLWHRFGEAVGFDAPTLDPSTGDGRTNETLGVTQIALLRRVNEALDGRIPQPGYARVVKNYFRRDLLTQHTSPRPACPPELVEALRQLSEQWLVDLAACGYAVHGELDELLPAEPEPATAPDEVDPVDVAATSAAVIADLLVEIAEQRQRHRRHRPSSSSSPPGPAPLRRRLSNRLRRLRRSTAAG